MTIEHTADPESTGSNRVTEVAVSLNLLLADVFTLYLKTKSFHWHMTGPHFRDYHLLLDEHAEQIFAMTDVIAERVRKIGEPTLRSVSHIGRLQRLADNDAVELRPEDMLPELREDNLQLAAAMRELHRLCDQNGDFATNSVIEPYIDEAERRVWFLTEITRPNGA